MRLFVFDIDGTLLPRGEQEIALEDIEAIKSLLLKGDVVALASGRPYVSLVKLMNLFGPGKRYMIGANGAALYDMEGNLLSSSNLSINDLYYFADRFASTEAFVYGYTIDSGLAIFHESLFSKVETLLCSIDPKNFVFLPREKMPKINLPLLKLVIGAPPEVSSTLTFLDEEKERYTINRSDPWLIEVLAKGSDKASRVEALRKHLNIKKEDVYCFGDAGNDLTMIKTFFGIAMGNATEDVKEVADYITKDVKEHGVSKAIKALNL